MKFSLYFLLLLSTAGIHLPTYSSEEPKTIRYTVLQEKPHNPKAFTQGLIFNNGMITETSGLYGKSFISQYNANNTTEKRRVLFPNNIFAEGVTLFKDHLYVLSWKSQKAFILNPKTFEMAKVLNYQGEGWGITHNNIHIITSNGSHKISYRDPLDFSITKTINVHDKKTTYTNINELEYAKGVIWANIWQSPHILAIDPTTGLVLGVVKLEELVKINNTIPQTSVLNGIAYDTEKDAFWITGKLWPKRYLIRLSWPELK